MSAKPRPWSLPLGEVWEPQQYRAQQDRCSVTRGFGGVFRAGIFTAIMVLCAFFNWVSDYNAANAGRPDQGDWGPEKVAGWTVAIFGIWAAWGWWKDIRGD